MYSLARWQLFLSQIFCTKSTQFKYKYQFQYKYQFKYKYVKSITKIPKHGIIHRKWIWNKIHVSGFKVTVAYPAVPVSWINGEPSALCPARWIFKKDRPELTPETHGNTQGCRVITQYKSYSCLLSFSILLPIDPKLHQYLYLYIWNQ